jgi:CPA1 family monovalent cation:H+ antiporter
MLAPTDALAITAVLRRAGGPESLIALMEGESLLNDASGEYREVQDDWLA